MWDCFSYYQLISLSIVLCYLGKYLTDQLFPGPPKDHLLLAPRPVEPHPTDWRYLFHFEKQKSLNINIASYFIETLASPHENTWNRRGGPITQTINHFSLNHNHRRSVEHTWKTLISCIEKGVKYTVKNVTKKHCRPYLLYSSSGINMLANSMENCIDLRYTTLLINCHRHTHGDNSVSRSTVNLAFRRLQPKITKIQKIQQGTNNEGKCKEARYRQVKQWLIMLERFPE